jgi:hypothetical protein
MMFDMKMKRMGRMERMENEEIEEIETTSEFRVALSESIPCILSTHHEPQSV